MPGLCEAVRQSRPPLPGLPALPALAAPETAAKSARTCPRTLAPTSQSGRRFPHDYRYLEGRQERCRSLGRCLYRLPGSVARAWSRRGIANLLAQLFWRWSWVQPGWRGSGLLRKALGVEETREVFVCGKVKQNKERARGGVTFTIWTPYRSVPKDHGTRQAGEGFWI